jgi:alpha-beta hydrolase superfamily lysophospholipase
MTLTAKDGLKLHLHRWAAGEPLAEIVLLHGYGEHAGRYAHVARAWNALGLSVSAVDLRGHGKSGGRRAHVDRFAEYHLDAAALVDYARGEAAGKPVLLFAHSMGALVAMDWLLAGGGADLAGLAFSSPFLGVALAVNPVKAGLGRVMSKIWPTLSLPAGIHGRHVTSDPAQAALYDSDPLNNKVATARWYTEALAAIDRVLAGGDQLRLPLLLLYAGADQLASADQTDRLAQKLSGADRTVERLAGRQHELVNEPEEIRGPLIERFGAWLVERAKRAQR